MITGSNARNSSEGGLFATFTSPNGQQFVGIKWPQTQKGKIFSVYGYRTWTEKALEYGIPILQKTGVPESPSGDKHTKINNAPFQNFGIFRKRVITGGNSNPEITDSSIDSCSFNNIGSHNRTTIAGESIAIGLPQWKAMCKKLPFTGLLMNSEVVLVFKGGTRMVRARINSNMDSTGNNSLDLFMRTGQDKLQVYDEQIIKPSGFFNNPGLVYVAPYDPVKHAGIPYWGQAVPNMVKDDSEYFWKNLYVKYGGINSTCTSDGLEFNRINESTGPFTQSTEYLKNSIYGNDYSVKGDKVVRKNVDCDSIFKGIGKYKEIIGVNSAGQTLGQGSFYSWDDPNDPPPSGVFCLRKVALCARYYAFKITGKLNESSERRLYDVFDESEYKPVAAGSLNSLVTGGAHPPLDPFSLRKGAYLYVFVFLGWSYKTKETCNLGADWDEDGGSNRVIEPGSSFKVWKFTHKDPKLKRKLYKNYIDQDVFGLNP